VSGGRVALTVAHAETGQMYQSIVPVSGLTVAECFEHYFDQSEQLPTHLWLAANEQGAGALLLQKLPKADAKDSDGWARVEQLAASVRVDELITLDAEVLLQRLFHELPHCLTKIICHERSIKQYRKNRVSGPVGRIESS